MATWPYVMLDRFTELANKVRETEDYLVNNLGEEDTYGCVTDEQESLLKNIDIMLIAVSSDVERLVKSAIPDE